MNLVVATEFFLESLRITKTIAAGSFGFPVNFYFVDGGVVPLDDVHNTAMAAEGGEK